MQKNSLFRKYFSICSLCVICSIVILGLVELLFFIQYYERDKYQLLERNARQAAAITSRNYIANNNGLINRSVISTAYSILASSIDAQLFLVDADGAILYPDAREPDVYGQEVAAGYRNVQVSKEIVQQILVKGIYEETGDLGGIFEKNHYTVGIPVVADNVTIGVLLASSSADGRRAFVADVFEIFLIGSLVVLMMAFIIIYFVTAQLIRPLKNMLGAIQSFSQGDFSKRVPVSGYDEIGQLSIAFNNMASTLASTETTRRSFVANVSHELKTPMTTIGGFVDGILDGTVPEEKREQYLQVVSSEVKRLSRLVRSMLDTARIEAGEMRVTPVAFDLAETLRQTVILFEQMIEEKNVSVEGLDMDPLNVTADVDLMHQVVYNLVENAVKFVDEGGTISFFCRADSSSISVTIRNSGTGLVKDEVPHIFERFYKSDKSRGLNKNGAGLGLYIVKTILNHHWGEIVVRSVEGEYTEFEFTIPTTYKAQ